jgi:hypothetical protein
MVLAYLIQKPAMHTQPLAHGLGVLISVAGGPLDICEQKGDDPAVSLVLVHAHSIPLYPE